MNVKFARLGWLISLFLSNFFFVSAVFFQYVQYGVSYPLGWDSPFYVFQAKVIIGEGVFEYLAHHGFGLFEQLLALSSWLTESPEMTLIVWQVVLAVSLVVLCSMFALRMTKSYFVASVTGIVTAIIPNTIRLFILPRQILSLVLLVFVLYNIAFVSNSFSVKNRKSVILAIVCASIAWAHPFTFLFLFFSVLIYLGLLSDSRNRQRTLKFLTLSSVLGILPLIPNLMNISANVFYEAPSYWSKTPVTLEYYTSTLVRWGGGTSLVIALTLFGLAVLLLRSKSTKDPMVTALAAWAVTSLVLFHISFLTSIFLANWSAYADRSFLIFPSSFLISLGIGVVSQNLVQWAQSWLR
jgi:hypothetical protein